MLNVLLIEDETLFAKSVLRRLEREGHKGTISPTLAAARHSLQTGQPDIILLDVRLPDGSGLELLREIRADEQRHHLPVVIMTAYGELEDAVSAMKQGATDYLKKPVDLNELLLTLGKVTETWQLKRQLDYSQVRESHGHEPVLMLGQTNLMQALQQQLERIVSLVDQSRDDAPVILINGETGTGKDVLARLYHASGSWYQRPYVHVDCASLPTELIEAELFGYERGAFTNAHQAKPGLIEVAEDGTLFLDEVGELPLALQSKLLNVLERRQVRRLGSTQEHRVNAHFVAASNRDLQQMVAEGLFRSDLYFRLKVINLDLPPLRERTEDISLLAKHFADTASHRYRLPTPSFSSQALRHLQDYHWPGNVRELQHVIERSVMLSGGGPIDEHMLMLHEPQPDRQSGADKMESLDNMTMQQVEKLLLEKALANSDGNVSRAARELGLTRMAMRYRMEKYQL